MSAPEPIEALSLPRLPSAKSLPEPPRNVSFPEPPISLSSPEPPSIVVGIVFVNAPPLSSIRMVSSPDPPLTVIAVTSARAKLKSATPSPSASTSSVSGWPACRRSTIVSSPLPPSTVRRPWSSLGGWIFALAALARLSAPCAFVIPAPATAVATATETTAGQSTRVVRDVLG